MDSLVLLLPGAVFVNDLVIARAFGANVAPGAPRRLDGIPGIALATAFVLTLSTALAWMAARWLLPALGLARLQPFAFLLAIAAAVTLVGLIVRARNPSLERPLAVALPLVAANAAMLGVALDVAAQPTLLATVTTAVTVAVAFGVLLTLFAAMRERLDVADVPAAWRGAPIALVTAGLLALALKGLVGLVPIP